MNIKMILPALSEARGIFWRPLKYSLFPPLGLATLAGFVSPEDTVDILDEHVEPLDLDDQPDLVVIQAYVTSAYRAYEIADHYRKRGIYVAMGGLHVTALPEEAARHADSVFLGPGEDTWPQFLRDYRAGCPASIYRSARRTLKGLPPARRDLIKRHLYLVPNSLVVSRGCPHACDFCYKESFYRGGRFFYTQAVDDALGEISRLPGRHVFFLDDHLFGNERFAEALFDGMRGMNRLWQAAGTVASVLNPRLIKKAVDSGLRSLFVGFENVRPAALAKYNKQHNVFCDYDDAVAILHGMGVMINGSFVFGMDDDRPDVFSRTVEWAIQHSLETATFHILTPYPGTALFDRMLDERRLRHTRWDLYDTRHAVYNPSHMSSQELEGGYRSAYREFYQWGSIFRSAAGQESWRQFFRHMMYCGAWKKCEPAWNFIIKCRQIGSMRPLMEAVLARARLADSQSVRQPSGNRRLAPEHRFLNLSEEYALPLVPGGRDERSRKELSRKEVVL